MSFCKIWTKIQNYSFLENAFEYVICKVAAILFVCLRLTSYSPGYHPIWKQPDLPLHIRLDGATEDLTTQVDTRRDHQTHVWGTPDHSGPPRSHEWPWTITPVLPPRDKCEYCKISNIRCTKSPNSNVSQLCLQLSSHNIFKHLSQVLSGEWRCSWSSTDRRCSNYIWVINNLIAY